MRYATEVSRNMIEAIVGKVIGIEETVLGRPETGVYRVDPATRELANPRRLQGFRVSPDGTLTPTDDPIEQVISLGGGWSCR